MPIALTDQVENALLYADDIKVFGCSHLHHKDNLRKEFAKLTQNNLKLNKMQLIEKFQIEIYLKNINQLAKRKAKTLPNCQSCTLASL